MAPPTIIIDPALPAVGAGVGTAPSDPATAAAVGALALPGATPDDFFEADAAAGRDPGDRDVIVIPMVPHATYSDALQMRLARAKRYPNVRQGRDLGKKSFQDLSTRPVHPQDLIFDGRIVPDRLVGYPTGDSEEVWLLYALSPWGELRVAVRDDGVYHSSLFGPWQDVVAAGIIAVGGGTVVRIDQDSGHFLPDEEDSLKLVRRILLALGIPMSDEFMYDFATRPDPIP